MDGLTALNKSIAQAIDDASRRKDIKPMKKGKLRQVYGLTSPDGQVRVIPSTLVSTPTERRDIPAVGVAEVFESFTFDSLRRSGQAGIPMGGAGAFSSDDPRDLRSTQEEEQDQSERSSSTTMRKGKDSKMKQDVYTKARMKAYKRAAKLGRQATPEDVAHCLAELQAKDGKGGDLAKSALTGSLIKARGKTEPWSPNSVRAELAAKGALPGAVPGSAADILQKFAAAGSPEGKFTIGG